MLPCDGCTTPAPQAATKTYEAKDGQVKLKLDRVLQSLVLVRIGQDLGSDSPAARAVHDLLELLASFPASFLVDKLSR
jgi:hypothetical protein